MENYENIKTVLKYMSDELASLKGQKDLAQTFEILSNINKRLAFQDEAQGKGQKVNKGSSLASVGLDACKSYRAKWAGNRLKY
jgi:hypothetical protein